MGVIFAVAAGCAFSAKRYTVLSHQFAPWEVASRARDPRSQRTLGQLILPEFAWADAIPEHSKVGVDRHSGGFVYALFGTDFRNEVVRLPGGKASSLIASLDRSHINYFVTRRDSPRDEIAQANTDSLQLVSDVGNLRVYRVM